MDIWLYLTFILVLDVQSIEEENLKLELDILLYELDNIIDNDLKSIPDELIYKCQLALTIWSVDGREDNHYPLSTDNDYINADRLMDKIRQTYLLLGGNEFDRQGFIRDVFTLQDKYIISAIQYYTFIKYYEHPTNPSYIYKLIQWNVYSIDNNEDFIPMYHLERSYSEEFGYIYVLGRKIHPNYHETLINFNNYCPTYIELKTFIIGDINGDMELQPLISSGYIDENF